MARKPDAWMPFHIGDYLKDTQHLTRDQHGAYFLLLLAYWSNGGPIRADDKALAAIAKATPPEWRRLRPVMASFFSERDGYWHQKRADAELAKATKFVEAKAAAGKRGAETRWQANSKTMAELSNSQDQTDAPLPQPIPQRIDRKTRSSLMNDVGAGLGSDWRFGVTITDPNDRLARFQKTLAEAFPSDGWLIVEAAADPHAKEHERCLDLCKVKAKELGKGWPRQWPS